MACLIQNGTIKQKVKQTPSLLIKFWSFFYCGFLLEVTFLLYAGDK